MKERCVVSVWRLGRMRYRPALRLQEIVADNLLRSTSAAPAAGAGGNVLMLLEHDPVYTTGLRQTDACSPSEETRLRDLGADFERTDRGGLITFHGPGQLVAYPILNLRSFPLTSSAQRKPFSGSVGRKMVRGQAGTGGDRRLQRL